MPMKEHHMDPIGRQRPGDGLAGLVRRHRSPLLIVTAAALLLAPAFARAEEHPDVPADTPAEQSVAPMVSGIIATTEPSSERGEALAAFLRALRHDRVSTDEDLMSDPSLVSPSSEVRIIVEETLAEAFAACHPGDEPTCGRQLGMRLKAALAPEQPAPENGEIITFRGSAARR
jgi:hypothetical protein